MTYNPLSQADRIERTNLLAYRIIDKALQSERGDIILAMNDADLEKMEESVARAVRNIIEAEAQRVSDYKWTCVIKEGRVIIDPTEGFKLLTDAEIEEAVTAYFEIDGKLQYRKVTVKTFGKGVGIDVGTLSKCYFLFISNQRVNLYVRVRPSHHRNINRRRRTSFLCLKSALRKAFRDSPFNRSQFESTCKHPGKPDHSHLEIFRHTDYVPRVTSPQYSYQAKLEIRTFLMTSGKFCRSLVI